MGHVTYQQECLRLFSPGIYVQQEYIWYILFRSAVLINQHRNNSTFATCQFQDRDQLRALKSNENIYSLKRSHDLVINIASFSG